MVLNHIRICLISLLFTVGQGINLFKISKAHHISRGGGIRTHSARGNGFTVRPDSPTSAPPARSSLVLTKLVNLSWSFRFQLPSALPLAESVRTQAKPDCRTPLLVYTRAGLRHQRYTLHFVAGQV